MRRSRPGLKLCQQHSGPGQRRRSESSGGNTKERSGGCHLLRGAPVSCWTAGGFSRSAGPTNGRMAGLFTCSVVRVPGGSALVVTGLITVHFRSVVELGSRSRIVLTANLGMQDLCGSLLVACHRRSALCVLSSLQRRRPRGRAGCACASHSRRR